MSYKKFENFREFLNTLRLDKQYQEGIKVIKDNLKKFKSKEQQAELYCFLGIFFIESGSFEEGIGWFEKVSKNDSTEQYARCLINIGVNYFYKKEYEKAINKWNLVEKEYSKKEYDRVRYWKAVYNHDVLENKENAISLLKEIGEIDYPKYYALAQWKLFLYNRSLS